MDTVVPIWQAVAIGGILSWMFLPSFFDVARKDVISAPRPTSPPVRRVTATKDGVENAMEYGLPSAHTLNTVCLSGYLLHYILSHNTGGDPFIDMIGYVLVCSFVGLIGVSKYLVLSYLS